MPTETFKSRCLLILIVQKACVRSNEDDVEQKGVPVFCSLILVECTGWREWACCARRVSDVVDRFGPQIKERKPHSL